MPIVGWSSESRPCYICAEPGDNSIRLYSLRVEDAVMLCDDCLRKAIRAFKGASE